MKIPMSLMAAAILLAGCASNGGALLPASDQVPVAQGVATLDAAYNVVAKIYLSQVATMAPGLKAKIKPLLIRAYALDQAVDSGQLLAGETDMATQIADATALIIQAKAALAPQ